MQHDASLPSGFAAPSSQRPRRLRFGIHEQLACAPGQSPRQRLSDVFEQVLAAEALGFESVWPVEQHFNAETSLLPAPNLFLSAIAARTTRLRLGTAITVLPLSHPVRVAEELTMLDLLSDGRVDPGFGRGIDPTHYRGFGVDQAESNKRLIEGLEIVQRAWNHDQFSFKGRHYEVHDITVVPRPTQPACPPLRVAANSLETAELMGRLGHPIFVAGQINPLPKLPEFLAAYRLARVEAGFPLTADDVTLLLPVFVGEDEAAARRQLEPSVEHVCDLLRRKAAVLLNGDDAARRGYDAVLQRLRSLNYDGFNGPMAIFDGPEGCIERLRAVTTELGVGGVICWFNPGGLVAHRDVMASMERFASDVMPALIGTPEKVPA